MPLLNNYPIAWLFPQDGYPRKPYNIIGGDSELKRHALIYCADEEGDIIYGSIRRVVNEPHPHFLLLIFKAFWYTAQVEDPADVFNLISPLLAEPSEFHPYPGFKIPPFHRIRTAVEGITIIPSLPFRWIG